jgi:hypothetical protein
VMPGVEMHCHSPRCWMDAALNGGVPQATSWIRADNAYNAWRDRSVHNSPVSLVKCIPHAEVEPTAVAPAAGALALRPSYSASRVGPCGRLPTRDTPPDPPTCPPRPRDTYLQPRNCRNKRCHRRSSNCSDAPIPFACALRPRRLNAYLCPHLTAAFCLGGRQVTHDPHLHHKLPFVSVLTSVPHSQRPDDQ